MRAEAGGQMATDSFFDLDEVMAEGLGAEPGLGDFLIELQLWKVRAGPAGQWQVSLARQVARALTPDVGAMHAVAAG